MLQVILDALAAAGEAGLTATEVVQRHPDISKWNAAYHLVSAYRLGLVHYVTPRHGDGIEIRVALVTPPSRSLVDVHDEGDLAAHLTDER